MSITRLFLPPFSDNAILSQAQEKIYGILRRIVPSVRERHRLEWIMGPFGYWEEIQKYQCNFLESRGLKPKHKLLDIGCGPLAGGIAFISYLNANNYVGIDVKKEAIEEAHIQIVKTGLTKKNPLLFVSQSFGREELGKRKFDFIWASQIIYHLDESTLNNLFKQVSRRMAPGSKFICDIIGFPNKVIEESYWNEFKFHLHSIELIRSISEKYDFSMLQLGQIERFGYPEKLALKTNEMLEFTKKEDTDKIRQI